MEAEEARTESKRLKAELETSNSCAKGEGEEGTVQGESDAEIARLRKKIAELEERETDAGIDTETGEEDEIDESDRLRTELRQAREEAAVRTAGLETQLADKEVRIPCDGLLFCVFRLAPISIGAAVDFQ